MGTSHPWLPPLKSQQGKEQGGLRGDGVNLGGDEIRLRVEDGGPTCSPPHVSTSESELWVPTPNRHPPGGRRIQVPPDPLLVSPGSSPALSAHLSLTGTHTCSRSSSGTVHGSSSAPLTTFFIWVFNLILAFLCNLAKVDMQHRLFFILTQLCNSPDLTHSLGLVNLR